MVGILDLFKPEELTETNSGFKTECPHCGLQGGRTEGFILFPKTDTSYCHSSGKWFTLLETYALKNKIITCLDGREKGQKISSLDKEQVKEAEELFKDEFGVSEIKSEFYVGNKLLDLEYDFGDDNIGMSKQNLDFDIFTNELLDTSHLPGYDIFEADLGLDGENYRSLKKALYYYQNSLRQDTVEYSINNKTKIDNRTHLLIIGGAGSGKTTIKNQNKRVLKSFNSEEGYIEVAGVSHPEQLVGKIKYKGRAEKKEAVKVPGLLAYKCLMNDEAQEMLNESNEVYAKAQRIKRLAMDSYGLNKITKKLVDDDPKDILEYFSPTRVCDFAHPHKLESAFFGTGSFRRYDALNVDYEQNIDIDIVAKFDFDDVVNDKDWCDFLDNQYSKQTNVRFDLSTLQIIAHYHKVLLFYLLKHKNPNAFRYALLTRYALRGMFAKNVLILAKSKQEKIPKPTTVIEACKDKMLFIFKSIETYNQLGNMGTSSDVWGGVNDNDAQALDYLYQNKAFSKTKSKISVKKFQSILANFYGCKVTQSRAHHYRLKRDGFVDSAQFGKDDSRVWLKFIPKEINLVYKNNCLDFWENNGFLANSCVKGVKGDSPKNTLLTTLKSYFIDDKSFDKFKDDGGVGVMGSILINKHICVQPHKNKNKNNIICKGRGGKTDTPDTLLKRTQIQPISKGKYVVEGIKTPKSGLSPLKSDRQVQFYDAKECENIKSNITKEELKDWIEQNPKHSDAQLYNKFGVGCFKLKEGLKNGT